MDTLLMVSCLALWPIVFLLGFLLLGALRTLGLLRWELAQLQATTPSRINRNGLRVGSSAPDFALPSVSGREVRLSDFAGRRVLLVFTQAGCGPCQAVLPELDRLQQSGEVQVVVVKHAEEISDSWESEYRPQFSVLVQKTLDVSKRYQAYATPFAFLIDESGVIRSRGLVGNRQHLRFVLSGVDGDAAAVRAVTPES